MMFPFLIATLLITDFIFGEQNIKDQKCPENSLYFFKNNRHFCWILEKSPYLNFGKSEGLCLNDHGKVPIVKGPEDIATVSELIRNRDWKYNETSNVCFYRKFFQFSQPILAVNYPRTPEYIKQLNNKNSIYFDKKFDAGDRIIISFVQNEDAGNSPSKILFFSSKKATSPCLTLTRNGPYENSLQIAIGHREPEVQGFQKSELNYGITVVIDISRTNVLVKIDNETPRNMLRLEAFDNSKPGYLKITNLLILNLEHRKNCGDDQAKMSILEGFDINDNNEKLADDRRLFYLSEIANVTESRNMELIPAPRDINDMGRVGNIEVLVYFGENLNNLSYLYINVYNYTLLQPWKIIEFTNKVVKVIDKREIEVFSEVFDKDLRTMIDGDKRMLSVNFYDHLAVRYVQISMFLKSSGKMEIVHKGMIPLHYASRNPISFLQIGSNLKIIGTEIIPNTGKVTYSFVKTCNFRIEFDKISDTVPYDDKCPDHTMVLCERELKNVNSDTKLKPKIVRKFRRASLSTEMRKTRKFGRLRRIESFVVGMAISFMIIAIILELTF